MEIHSKKSGILSRIFLKDTKRTKGTREASKREIPDLYAFVTVKKEKEGIPTVVETKYRLSKHFANTHLSGMTGSVDQHEPILFVYPKDCGLPKQLFTKRKDAEESEAIVFVYSHLTHVLKTSGLLDKSYGKKDDEKVVLKLTDITEKYIVDLDEELPEGFKVFQISADTETTVSQLELELEEEKEEEKVEHNHETALVTDFDDELGL
jgi:hypothetical protein